MIVWPEGAQFTLAPCHPHTLPDLCLCEQAQLQAPGVVAAVAEAQAAEAAAQARASTAEHAADTLKAELAGTQALLERVQEQLQQAKSECELYTTEIEVIGHLYRSVLTLYSYLHATSHHHGLIVSTLASFM